MGKLVCNPKMIPFDILFVALWIWMYVRDRHLFPVMGPIIIALSLLILVINVVLFTRQRNRQSKEHHA